MMSITLIVKTFNQEKQASRVLETIRASRESKHLGLQNAVVVTRDQARLVTLYQSWQLPATPGDPDCQLAKMFAETIFSGYPKIKLERLIAAGLDERFLNELVNSLRLDGSALLIFIPRSSLIDDHQLLDLLSSFDGTLHKTTFTQQVLDKLIEPTISE
ncbi:MAG: hypothetical protein MUO67_09595 [Anaerolineales bacterium]|nr:hypothetical protein [Anaerolineales bacterium]